VETLKAVLPDVVQEGEVGAGNEMKLIGRERKTRKEKLEIREVKVPDDRAKNGVAART
jgi:hypothetical protein